MGENKKFCLFCGKQIPSDAKFCEFCGKQLNDGVVTASVENTRVDNSAPFTEPTSEPVTPANEEKPIDQTYGDINTSYVAVNKVLEETNKQMANQEPQVNEPQTNKPEKKSKPDKDNKGGAGKVVLIVLLAILVLIGVVFGGSFLFRNQLASSYPDGGFDLPFDYVLEIPWIQEAKDNLASTGNGSPSDIIGTTGNDQTTQPQGNTTTNSNTNVSDQDDVLAANFNELYGPNPSASDYANIKTIYIDGQNITINQSYICENEMKVGSANLEILSNCPNLETLTVQNINNVTLPTSSMPSVKTLVIDNCGFVDASVAGITKFTSVSDLEITRTNLADLTNISRMGSVRTLRVDQNAITSTEPIKANMSNLSYCSITNNMIWDYRGLANVATVDIWGRGSTDQNNIYTMDRDYNSRQIQVLVIDLRIRTAHNTIDDSNILEERAVKNAYYYILDEYWDGGEGITWYKVGNDMWIASKEGTWTKLYE